MKSGKKKEEKTQTYTLYITLRTTITCKVKNKKLEENIKWTYEKKWKKRKRKEIT